MDSLNDDLSLILPQSEACMCGRVSHEHKPPERTVALPFSVWTAQTKPGQTERPFMFTSSKCHLRVVVRGNMLTYLAARLF